MARQILNRAPEIEKFVDLRMPKIETGRAKLLIGRIVGAFILPGPH